MTKRTLSLLASLLSSIAAGGLLPALACTHRPSPAAPTHTTSTPPGSDHGVATTGTDAAAGGSGGGCGGGGGFGGYDGYDGFGGSGGALAAGGAPGTGATNPVQGTGGDPGLGGGSAVTGASSTAQTSGGSASSTSSGSVACALGHVVIGEIRSRGAGGATDEFVALFNATGSPVTLDASWVLEVRGADDAGYRSHWTGSGLSIPAWGHFLIAGAGYAETPAPDDALSTGIPDAASLWLVHSGATVDAVCYAYGSSTQAAFDATFTCAGLPASNLPHDDTSSAASDTDASIARKPGGPAGNCTDTGDNAADFVAQTPATPESTASPPTP